MSLYILVFLAVIIFFYLIDVWHVNFKVNGKFIFKNADNSIYFILLSIMWIMLAFRYGQGADYFSYKDLFEFIKRQGIQAILQNDVYPAKESGWRLLNVLIVTFGIPYEMFIFILSTLQLILLNRFAQRYCTHMKCLMLVMIYHTIYFTYLFSAIRQGLVLCIFLGIMLPLIEDKKYYRYIVWCIVVGSLHYVGFFLLLGALFPFLGKIKISHMESVCLIVAIIMTIFNLVGGGKYLAQIMPDFLFEHVEVELGIGAILKRWILTVVVFFCYHHSDYSNDDFLSKLYIFLLIGAMLFFTFSGITLLASRLYSLWGDGVEIIYIANYLRGRKGTEKVILCTTMIILSAFLLVRNIDAEIYRSYYRDNIKAFNYPYISILDKEVISDYRTQLLYR